MLQIRREQDSALLAVVREAYVERILAYFRRHWTADCAAMDDDALRAMIRAARSRAERYGISVEADVVRFTEVWLVLGADFDTSPKHPWAAVILANEDADATIKVEQLAQAASDVARPAQSSGGTP